VLAVRIERGLQNETALPHKNRINRTRMMLNLSIHFVNPLFSLKLLLPKADAAGISSYFEVIKY
jgi:hypothetical protein